MMGKKVKLRKDEGGYALVLMLILLILVGLIIGPLLLLMTTSLMSSQRYEERMFEYYAADAGIEDGAYKIQHEDASLPPTAGDPPYEYTIADVNGNEVSVEIQRVISEDPSDEVYKITSTAGSATTTIVSYVKADRVDLSSFGDNAINTNCIECYTIKGTVNPPDSIEDNPEYWPTADQLAAYFLAEVDVSDPFPYGTIDVDATPIIGPLYRDGNLNINNTGSAGATATLNGTVYVTGDLEFEQPGGAHAYTIDLNGQSIFVEGSITTWPGHITFTGSGIIIAVEDIDFSPNVLSEEGDFIFVMSVEGEVTFQPFGDFHGSVAGDVWVTLQPGSSLTLTGPGEGFEWPAGGEAVLDIRTYTIQ